MVRVIWQREHGEPIEFLITAESTVIGRDESADLRVSSRGVSRRHARLESREGGFFLRDLGSTNGTALNGTPLEGEAPLSAGDTILLGDQTLTFEVDDESGATRSALATEPLTRSTAVASARRAVVESSPVNCAAIGNGKLEVLPRLVGKFQLLEKLGQGGMGAVYRARDLDSNREVAVKFIRQQIGRKEAFLQFFHHREAVLAREIDHENVIRVFEHGVEADQHYISMEYVPGRSLYQALKAGPLAPRDVLEILRQVACGLSAAHRQGVVHSDVKPANILLVDESPAWDGDSDEERPVGLSPSRDGILEFEGEVVETVSLPTPVAVERHRDEGLLEEIRRRVCKSAEDVLVDPPYFQRPSEMRFLDHYLARTASGRGFFVLVEGEPGAGKSRLISEFLLERKSESKDDVGVVFLDLDCGRIEGILELHARFSPEVAPAKSTLRELCEALKKRFRESEQRIILRVLDLGRASPLVCDLLAEIGRLMETRPVLVLASLHHEELRQNDSLKVLLEIVSPHLKELYLRPLTEYQIQRYLDSLFEGALSGADLAGDLYRLSEGNFARLLELLRSFFERAVLRFDESAKQIVYRPNYRELELEEGKNLYEKFRQYSKTQQRVLTMAAFIGERFFFDTLLRLLDVDETSLFFFVRHLLADGFFREESRTWYGFTNVAFQRYMAERVPPPERPHIHRKLSRLLQNVPVPESAELQQLRARHYTGCREYSKAVHSLLEGAHLARNEYKIDLMREMYQEVLRIYRELSSRSGPRKEVAEVLREWFRRDGNWYEILGDMGAEEARATVKIADFGISFRAADEERGYRVGKRPALGTPRYLAPERGKGEAGGPYSDVFSLGIIAYEMVVGEPPFPGLKGGDVARAYREQPVRVPREKLRGYPPGFDRLLEGLLAIEPSRRWEAERIVREIVKLQFDLRMNRQRGAGDVA